MPREADTSSREIAFAKVKELRTRYGDAAERIHDASEASTRVMLIDEILVALGWSRADFNPETPAGKGWIDYLLSADQIPRFIVEAKKTGHTFAHPKPRLHESEYSLAYLKRAFKAGLTNVLEQATTYAREKAVPYAVLTNGAEWLLVQVIATSSQDPERLKGFYFGNLLSDHCNFDLFWELLSKPAVMDGSLEEHLSQLNTVPASETLMCSNEYGDLRWKPLISDRFLREFYSRFFTDITDEGRRRMLERCFATDARLNQYQSELKRALRDTAPGFLPIDTQDISPGEGQKLLLEETGDQAGRVILVTGSVGCGKSTLVTKVLVEAKQQERNRKRSRNLIVLKIDLIDEVNEEARDTAVTLWRYIEEQWYKEQQESYTIEALRRYFEREISGLRREQFADVIHHDESAFIRKEAELLNQLRSDPERFFSRCWKYYKQRGFGIALIIDNVDRASAAYQQQVYAFAHKVARLTGATVIVTMRESTFFRGQESSFLDVRPQDFVLHLQAPNLEQVIAKRIQYIQHDIANDHRVSAWRRSDEWNEFYTAAIEHTEVLKQTFLSGSGRNLLGLLASISWHDVRFFLETLRRLHFQLGSSPRSWQEDEVIAALMSSFDIGRTAPVITNIYRPPYPNYKCYYLKLRILILLIYGLRDGEVRKGLKLQRLLVFARLYGYQTRWAERAIEELVRERYLECLEAPAASEYTKDYRLSREHSFRASPLAVSIIQKIAVAPIYLGIIGSSLPFHAPPAFESYKSALRTVLFTLDEQQLERAAIDLLLEANLHKVVAQYLISTFNDERPAESLAQSHPEISATEEVIERVLENLRSSADISLKAVKKTQPPLHQLPLFDKQESSDDSTVIKTIPKPSNISTLSVGRSELAPLIFWALVELRANGKYLCSGVEITEIINTYLVDDHNRKFPNNISRALRNPTLRAQPWLLVDRGHHHYRVLYGLTEGWQEYWRGIFETEPPLV